MALLKTMREDRTRQDAADTTGSQNEETGMDTTQRNDDPMYRAHERTYKGVMRLLTVSTVAIAVVLALMGIFLV